MVLSCPGEGAHGRPPGDCAPPLYPNPTVQGHASLAGELGGGWIPSLLLASALWSFISPPARFPRDKSLRPPSCFLMLVPESLSQTSDFMMCVALP